MEKDVVCLLECPWFGGCLATAVLTYFCIVPPIQNGMYMKKKIKTCVSKYTISNSACASWGWTSCSWISGQFCYVLWWQRQCFFKQQRTAAVSFKEMQTTCQAQTPPIVRSQTASSVTSSGILNFQKIRQNFWHLPCWVIIAGWWNGMLLKQNTINWPKGHIVKVNNFLFIFIVHITTIVLLSQKQELTNEF